MQEVSREIDLNDMDEIVQDLKGVEALIVHLESSEYFKGAEEDSLTFRAIRSSIEHSKDKLIKLMGDYYTNNKTT